MASQPRLGRLDGATTVSELKQIRWDWYTIPFEWGKDIAQVPGVQYKNGFQVHRTHLPLLRSKPGVAELLADINELGGRDGLELGIQLRPWQRSGIDWIAPRRGVLLADEMRLGKTLTALLSHDTTSTRPLVVLAPLDTRPVWARNFAKVFPGVEVVYLTGKTLDPERIRNARIVFSHYDILTYHQITSLQPETLILDEAHLLSNPTSKRTKSVLFYASVARRVITLSGTPLWNTSKGLWALLAVCAPGAWGKLFDFAQRYCSPSITEYGWRYNGVSNREEWLARRSEIVLARTWKTEMPDLPPTHRETVTIPLDRDDQLAVDFAAAELAKSFDRHIPITVLTRYRQAVGKFKVEPAVEQIEKFPGPTVVWVWHKTIARAIAKKIDPSRPVFVMTGDDDGDKRADTVDAWTASSNGVLIATLAVGQVGIDLSHGGDVVLELFVEVDWTPAVLSQAEMRPFHPDRPMIVKYLVLDHEIDQALMAAVLMKLERGARLEMAAAGSTFDEMTPDPEQDASDLLRDLGELLLRTA